MTSTSVCKMTNLYIYEPHQNLCKVAKKLRCITISCKDTNIGRLASKNWFCADDGRTAAPFLCLLLASLGTWWMHNFTLFFKKFSTLLTRMSFLWSFAALSRGCILFWVSSRKIVTEEQWWGQRQSSYKEFICLAKMSNSLSKETTLLDIT